MKRMICFAVLVAASVLLVACNQKTKAKPVVVLDNWWMYDYAENACESAAQAVKAGYNAELCVAGAKTYAADFEQQLNTAFATEEVCNDVDFIGFHPDDPNVKKASEAQEKPHWFLMVSLSEPTKMNGEWTIQFDDKKDASGRKFFKEEIHHDLHTVARHVCQIVKGKGGNLQPS